MFLLCTCIFKFKKICKINRIKNHKEKEFTFSALSVVLADFHIFFLERQVDPSVFYLAKPAYIDIYNAMKKPCLEI